MIRLCKCGNEARPGQKSCKVCHAAYMRKWRAENPLTPIQKWKDNCRSYAGVYLRRGKIVPEPCIVTGCGKKAEMHHEDYSKPLDIIWICREHHLELHSGD